MNVVVTPEQIATIVAIGFGTFRRRFRSITRRAHARFEGRDWAALQRDALERIDAYGEAIDHTIEALAAAGYQPDDRDTWSVARAMFRSDHVADPFHDIAETFFNSVARRLFGTKGIDPYLEFLAPARDAPRPDHDTVVRRYVHDGDGRELLDSILRDCRFQASWADRTHDIAAGADRLPPGSGTVEVIDTIFYRGKGAYVVGRVITDASTTPFALAVRHDRTGLRLAAVLVGEGDLAILFSYTRASFLAVMHEPAAVVGFVGLLLPTRKRSELYASIGFRKQAKTEGYRELMSYLETNDDVFVAAPGVPGLVMVVFTLEGYDVVLKVIKDRFPPQKSVTPSGVEDRYRFVSRHDRAGRLVEAHRFVDLRLPARRFGPRLLEELLSDASRTVTLDDDEVTLSVVYVERKVVPLDVYLREAAPDDARLAILDYGNAIKNLAASNIFPGDMLLKNFGVTNRGRVVFYDYDEIGMLTDHRFRRFPSTGDPFDELAEVPSFGVGPRDVFPEELERFLGLDSRLRAVFGEQHEDLFDPDFWVGVQTRIDGGETIEILPYRRSRSLPVGAGVGAPRRRIGNPGP